MYLVGTCCNCVEQQWRETLSPRHEFSKKGQKYNVAQYNFCDISSKKLDLNPFFKHFLFL